MSEETFKNDKKNVKAEKPWAFKKGWKGGPGRPKGLRNKATILIETIGQDKVDAAYHKMAEMSQYGDPDGCYNACRFIIERSSPPESGSRLFLGEGSTDTADEIRETAEKVVKLARTEEISMDDADKMMNLLEKKFKINLEAKTVAEIEEVCAMVKADNE